MDISLARNRTGARLAYVVVPLDTPVKREYTTYSKDGGLKTEVREEEGGYMVYFPRGHVIRIRNKSELDHYGLRLENVPIINMNGLSDPNSPLGRLFAAQNDRGRKEAWATMEDQVIRLATAKTGTVLMPEQVDRRPTRAVKAA